MDFPKSALELFAGTRVASVFLLSKGTKDIISINNGTQIDMPEPPNGIIPVKGDAFHHRIDQTYDLVVADPYYEDALGFLQAKIDEICKNTKIFIFVCGGIEDQTLRTQSKGLMESHFKKVEEHLVYGQSILVGTNTTSSV